MNDSTSDYIELMQSFVKPVEGYREVFQWNFDEVVFVRRWVVRLL
jgi:hypothetical protein